MQPDPAAADPDHESLAAVGDGGRFVRAKGAGHDIFSADPELVQATINEVLNAAE